LANVKLLYIHPKKNLKVAKHEMIAHVSNEEINKKYAIFQLKKMPSANVAHTKKEKKV